MSFKEAITDLERRGIMPLRAPSLDNTITALKRFTLRYPSELRKVILIAGTNGKGSTSKTLETLLRAAGQRTGMYSSPHLVDYRERILLNGKMVTHELFETAWRIVHDETADLPLSHFEMLTVMAAWIFFADLSSPKVDVAVFEVGLGGLWDATNAIPHGMAVISRLGLDHQEILGNTLVEIARNKFGIVTKGCRVVHQAFDVDLESGPKSGSKSESESELEALKAETMNRTPSFWREAPAFQMRVEYPDANSTLPRFLIESEWGEGEISLPGKRGAENTNLALAAFESLGFNPKEYMDDLSGVVWPARMQHLKDPWVQKHAACPVFLSGDHNPQGIDSLIELLKYYRWRELRVVAGVGIKKDLDEIFERLFTLPNVKVWLTQADFLGRDETKFGKWFERCEGFYRNPLDAIKAAMVDAKDDDLGLVTGSLYLAGDVLRLLQDSGL